MTIKEVETRSGMQRANIRFYEREGLITARRLDNGYRDYSEDDLRVLLRVKLLRSLHIPLDEIKSLRQGSADLSGTLALQIEALERERRDAACAQEVCRIMRADNADFASLDAAKYLAVIRAEEEKSGSRYFAVPGDTLPQVFHPWRRWFARALDLYICNILWWAFLGFVFHVNLADRSALGTILDTLVSAALMLVLEPLWLSRWATTPGKAIFGLRIETADGRRLSYVEGLERTWTVIARGEGCYIPIYHAVRLWKSYKLCSEGEIQPWDEGLSYTMKDTRPVRALAYIGAYAALFGVVLAIQSAQLLPPNRGALTVAQFVENYHYYQRYFGIDPGSRYLSDEGVWTQREENGFYIILGTSKAPEYTFDVEDGHVRGIMLQVALEGEPYLLTAYDTDMVLASLAFACAQDEMWIFSRMPAHIIKNIQDNPFQSFRFAEAGISFACTTEYAGYIQPSGTLLLPKEGAAEQAFSLQFSIGK